MGELLYRYRQPAFSVSLRLPTSTKSPTTLRNFRSPVCSTTPSQPPPREPLWVDPSPRAGRVQLSSRGHWTNPARRVLTHLGDGLHAIERSYVWLNTFDVGARCTLIETNNGLVVYSPLPLTNALRHAIDALGPVSIVLAPNHEHIDFVTSFSAAYPNAIILGPPGCRTRYPELPFTAEVFSAHKAHPALAALAPDVVPVFVPGAPFFDETLLFHAASHTLLVCDLWWNFPVSATNVGMTDATKLFAAAMNNVYAPVYSRILVRDRARFRVFFETLRNMGVRRIIPCHGDIVVSGGILRLEAFFPAYLKACHKGKFK